MKKLILFMCLGLVLSCSSDDNNPANNLNAKWNMIKHTSYVGSSHIVGYKTIWNIDVSKKTLEVNNSMSDTAPYMLSTGTYPITIKGSTITIKRTDHVLNVKYSINKNELTLENADYAIEPTSMKLEKIEIPTY